MKDEIKAAYLIMLDQDYDFIRDSWSTAGIYSKALNKITNHFWQNPYMSFDHYASGVVNTAINIIQNHETIL